MAELSSSLGLQRSLGEMRDRGGRILQKGQQDDITAEGECTLLWKQGERSSSARKANHFSGINVPLLNHYFNLIATSACVTWGTTFPCHAYF